MTNNKSNIIYSPSSNKNNIQNKQTINRSDYLNNNKQSPSPQYQDKNIKNTNTNINRSPKANI